MSEPQDAVVNKRKWFDLQSFRGWVEAVGALVTVIGGAVAIYFQVFPVAPVVSSPPAAVAATTVDQRGGVNVVGSQNLIQIGYTFEQYEAQQKGRQDELRGAYEAQGQSEERRKELESKLQEIEAQIENPQESYRKRLAELQGVAAKVEALGGQVADAKRSEALEALNHGDTNVANALLVAGNSIAPPAPSGHEPGPHVNIISPAEGGELIFSTGPKWDGTIDEKAYNPAAAPWFHPNEEAVFGFKDGDAAVFDEFAIYVP